MKNNRLLFVFDFDGTLANTQPYLMELFNCVAKDYGFGHLDLSDPKLRHLEMRQLLQRLGISVFQAPAIVRKIRSEMRTYMPRVEPIHGIIDSLHALCSRGVDLALVTSNERDNFDQFALQHQLPPFLAIATGSSLFGKARKIRKLVSEQPFYEKVFYIGDESRDIEAAKKANVLSVAVSWGFNSREHLEKMSPTFLIDTPKELLDIANAS